MRLPRTPDPNDSSQRIPAVSDRTFNRVRSETRDPDARDTLSFMQNLHGLSGPARGRAEQDHLRPAIDKKHNDIRQAHKDAWRRGAVETPDLPSRRVAVEQVIREFCAQVREVITSACRHIANLVEQEHRQRQRQEINRQLERARQHPELERGYDREGPSR